MLTLFDDRAQIATVAARWRRQYFRDGVWQHCIGDSETIYRRLAAVDPTTATRADVEAVIGNDTWVGADCNECGNRQAVIQIGDEPDYDSATVNLCAGCVRKVVDLLQAHGVEL